jgi:2-dehydro-3-deoxyphosphooctonate aldolase (KDO 8-P synthase)
VSFAPILRTPEVHRGAIRYGGAAPLLLIAGPDSLESEALALEVAEALADLGRRLDVGVVFKGSYLKANRSSPRSYRGPGIEAGLRILARVREATGLPVTSDVHDAAQVRRAADVLDVIQIPAYLSRQNDLLEAAASSGRFVNIKKGQFLAPEQIPARVEAATGASTPGVLVTERGTFFGYGDLVNDLRALPRIRRHGIAVIFDATHSVQRPGGRGDTSGGDADCIPFLARAAAGAGCEGLFLEVHPEPEKALCDGPSSLRLDQLEPLLRDAIAIDRIARGR